MRFHYANGWHQGGSALLVIALLSGCASSPSPTAPGEGSSLSPQAKRFKADTSEVMASNSPDHLLTGGYEQLTQGDVSFQIESEAGVYTDYPALGFNTVLEREYVLGDRDSLAEARTILHAEIKEEGARRAGAYVSRQEVLDHTGLLKETLSMITATIIETETLSESVGTTPSGRPVLTLKVRVHADGDTLREQVGFMHENRAMRQQLSQATRESERLHRRLQQKTVRDAQRNSGSRARSLDADALPLGDGQFRLDIAHAEDVIPANYPNPYYYGGRQYRREKSAVLDLGVVSNYNEWSLRGSRLFRLINTLNEALGQQLSARVERKNEQGNGWTYRVRVDGIDMDTLQARYEDVLGVSFGEKGWIGQDDIDQMTPWEKASFWAAWEQIASFPVGFEVLVPHRARGANHPITLGATQMLIAPVQLKQNAQGESYVAQMMNVSSIYRQSMQSLGELPDGIALAFLKIPNNSSASFDRGILRIDVSRPYAHLAPDGARASITQHNVSMTSFFQDRWQ